MSIDLKGDDWHGLEIRNRHEQNMQSSGYKVRFASLSVDTALMANVIDYSYDAIGRLQEAVYADSLRSYAYDYDVAGNRLQEQVMIDNTGTPVITTTNWTYNNANQIATMQVGSNPVSNFQYDANGNLTNDGQLAYTWDRANRLTTLNNGSYNTHYVYDGDSKRVQQTIGGIATDYLLDIQPQLAFVLKETTPSETLTYVHSPKGVHAVEDNIGDWHFMLSDGLGSVRSQVDDLAQVEASQAFSPYGQVYGIEGTFTGSFAYTGEQVDESGMSYLRARYYNPIQATFASLDPFEGVDSMPMSLNGYAYVHGNPIMNTDPTGMMVAGRMLNIDTSGTSRILQSWSNALKDAFTIPSLSLVKSMNSGMCGDGSRVADVSKPDSRFYSLPPNGSDIQQDGTPTSLANRDMIIDDIRENETRLFPTLANRGLDDFVMLSNMVAELVNDNLRDYLYVMNGLLLGWRNEGHRFVTVIAGARGPENQILLGNNGLHCDYDDRNVNQINYHIWAFVAQTASPDGFPPITGAIGHAGTLNHEFMEFTYNSEFEYQEQLADANQSVMDYLADELALDLGKLLWWRIVQPSNFGNLFRMKFSNGYLDHISCSNAFCKTLAGYAPWELDLEHSEFLYNRGFGIINNPARSEPTCS